VARLVPAYPGRFRDAGEVNVKEVYAAFDWDDASLAVT
jgi:hypothetical protein